MHVVYARQEPPGVVRTSVFLAGPTPRDPSTPSWRPEALRLLAEMPESVDLVVYVPEPEDGVWTSHYDEQRAWELRFLQSADLILFYVPRDLTVLPGTVDRPKMAALTTNVEWGKFYNSGRAVLAYPANVPHLRYLVADAQDEGVPVFSGDSALREALRHVVASLGAGADRSAGERDVPLCIWGLPSFQSWYRALVCTGNRLDAARVLWAFRPSESIFSWVVHVDVYVTAEDRHKKNEFVFARPDTSAVVAYCDNSLSENLFDTEVVVVREFRSPRAGLVRELPGGSSNTEKSPAQIAAEEFEQETGVAVGEHRLRHVGERQVGSTLTAHVTHVFAVELTREEIARLKAEEGVCHGVSPEEQTYVEVRSLCELLADPVMDWTNLGMILQAIA